MTIASLDEFKKVAAELSTINTIDKNEQWLNLPAYYRQELLQKMLIAFNAINAANASNKK